MALIKLFCELIKGDLFHYYDSPMRRYMKTDDKYAVGISGTKQTHPHVLIVHDPPIEINIVRSVKKEES